MSELQFFAIVDLFGKGHGPKMMKERGHSYVFGKMMRRSKNRLIGEQVMRVSSGAGEELVLSS
jgi:hypothetical protein